MTPEEIAFFEAVKPVIRRFWWDGNKMGAPCPFAGCYGEPNGSVPDDTISHAHSEDCKLKDAILAYWAMIDTKSHPGALPTPPMLDPDDDDDDDDGSTGHIAPYIEVVRVLGGEVNVDHD